MSRKYDIVVYGATGFSGRLICEEFVLHVLPTLGHNLPDAKGARKIRWAVGARSSSNLSILKENLDALAKQKNVEEYLPSEYLTVSTDDKKGLEAMCESTTLLLNCAGPFAVCGQPVVEACVAKGAHYTDINGEPGFVRAFVWPLHERAIAAGVYLIPCCGFDCVPADVGTFRLLEKRAKNAEKTGTTPTPSVVDTFVQYNGSLSNGTFYTLLNSITSKPPKVPKSDANATELRKLPRVSQKGSHYSKLGKCYVFPLPSADPQIIARSFSLPGGQRDPLAKMVGYRHWLHVPGFTTFIKRLIVMTIFGILAKTGKFGIAILKWWRGTAQHKGPSADERRREPTCLRMIATEAGSTKPADSVTVNGTHCYDLTASAACLSAVSLIVWLQGGPKVPVGGGEKPDYPTGGAWTIAPLFAQLPMSAPTTPGEQASLLDYFQKEMVRRGAMNVVV